MSKGGLYAGPLRTDSHIGVNAGVVNVPGDSRCGKSLPTAAGCGISDYPDGRKDSIFCGDTCFLGYMAWFWDEKAGLRDSERGMDRIGHYWMGPQNQ